MLMMPTWLGHFPKPWGTDAHDAGRGGPVPQNPGQLMLMMLAVLGRFPKTLGS